MGRVAQRREPFAVIAFLATIGFFCSSPAAVHSQSSLFSGKTITIKPTPLLPEDHERAIREIPREREPIETFKQLIGAGPLPPRP